MTVVYSILPRLWMLLDFWTKAIVLNILWFAGLYVIAKTSFKFQLIWDTHIIQAFVFGLVLVWFDFFCCCWFWGFVLFLFWGLFFVCLFCFSIGVFCLVGLAFWKKDEDFQIILPLLCVPYSHLHCPLFLIHW